VTQITKQQQKSVPKFRSDARAAGTRAARAVRRSVRLHEPLPGCHAATAQAQAQRGAPHRRCWLRARSAGRAAGRQRRARHAIRHGARALAEALASVHAHPAAAAATRAGAANTAACWVERARHTHGPTQGLKAALRCDTALGLSPPSFTGDGAASCVPPRYDVADARGVCAPVFMPPVLSPSHVRRRAFRRTHG
jgi:hypothetical protein